MAQAIVDPAEIRRFAHNLKVFTGDVRGDLSSLHTQLLALGDTWRDQEHERFTQEFEQTVAVLEKFLEVAEQHVPFLMRKAERIEDYLTQRERMNPGADVQAIDALQDWHNAVCLFRDEALDALGSIGMEVRRAFDWIDEEAKAWHREAREAEQAVVQAKAELSQRRTPNFADRIPDTSVQEENLARAKARLRFAEDQMDVCRKWAVRLPKMISEDYEGPARRLNNFLEMDLPAAIAHLAARIEALHRYTQVQPDAAPPAPAAPGGCGMKVDAGRGKLYDAQKVLRLRWDQVSELWSDQIKLEFEEKTWLPLDQLTSEGLRAIDRLAQILTECRRSCSGEGAYP